MRKGLNSSGYTLLELVVVLAILVITFYLATLGFGAIVSNAKAKNAAYQLASDFRYTQELSLATGLRHRIEFYGDNDNPRYAIIRIEGSNKTVKISRPFPKGLVSLKFSVGMPLGSIAYTGYGGDGRPSNAGTYSITYGSKTYYVSVASVVGSVNVKLSSSASFDKTIYP